MQRLNSIVAFVAGFLCQFNIFLGGSGAGASAVGGYGFRSLDFFAAGCVLMLVTLAFASERIISLFLFAIVTAALFGLQIATRDAFTATIAIHYLLYCLAGLFLAVAASNQSGLNSLCWGLVAGLLGSVGLYALADSGIPVSTLSAMGLAAGYAAEFGGYIRETPRYSGLWGHPNEAGHVSALASAAGAYLFITQRRLVPIALTAAGLAATFYYTLSRGGLMSGAAILALSVMVTREGRIFTPRLVLGAVVVGLVILGATQLDFVASRFGADQNASGNFYERLESTVAGIWLIISYPLGQSVDDFLSLLRGLTGGVGSPHNGFVFMGAILGLPALIALIWAIVVNLRVRASGDLFFALLTLQICISFCFEQLPGTVSYSFAVGLLIARAYLKTPFGAVLVGRSAYAPPLPAWR
jgi:hypothetical protein